MYNNLIGFDESKDLLYVFKNLTFILMILFIAILWPTYYNDRFFSKVFYNIYPMREKIKNGSS